MSAFCSFCFAFSPPHTPSSCGGCSPGPPVPLRRSVPLALRAGAPGHPQRLLMELWERGNEFGLTPQAGGAPLGAGGGVGTSWQLPLVALNFVLLPVRLPGLVSAGSEISQNGANNGRLLLIPHPNKCWGQLCAARCSEPSKRQGVPAALVASPRPPGPKGSRVRSLGAGYQSVPRVVPLQGIQEDYSLIFFSIQTRGWGGWGWVFLPGKSL